eukprot:6213141-Pleurochrysis_carterae.AAC.6
MAMMIGSCFGASLTSRSRHKEGLLPGPARGRSGSSPAYGADCEGNLRAKQRHQTDFDSGEGGGREVTVREEWSVRALKMRSRGRSLAVPSVRSVERLHARKVSNETAESRRKFMQASVRDERVAKTRAGEQVARD